MKMKWLAASCLSLCCLVTMAFPLTPPRTLQSSMQKPRPEKFAALAYLPTGVGPAMVGAGATANVDLYVERYSTDAEAQQLASTLLKEGPEALLKALEKAKSIGKVSLVGRVGFFNLKFIRSKPTATGRRIIALSDRPIQFLEAYYSGRSTDYTFGIVELDLKTESKDEEKGKKKKEEGTGALIYAAKVKVLDQQQVEIETYSISPVQLRNVRKL